MTIKQIEAVAKSNPKHHPFTEQGTHRFMEAVLNRMFEFGDFHDIEIKIGSHSITIPTLPETFDCFEGFIHQAVKVYVEEYETEAENK